eukprot:scaffold234876_cov14-Tisochrysis_lutea.AAC.1
MGEGLAHRGLRQTGICRDCERHLQMLGSLQCFSGFFAIIIFSIRFCLSNRSGARDSSAGKGSANSFTCMPYHLITLMLLIVPAPTLLSIRPASYIRTITRDPEGHHSPGWRADCSVAGAQCSGVSVLAAMLQELGLSVGIAVVWKSALFRVATLQGDRAFQRPPGHA